MREQELYNFLKENFYPDLTFSNDKMSQWDCYSPSHFHRIELKCRGSHYERKRNIIISIKDVALILILQYTLIPLLKEFIDLIYLTSILNGKYNPTIKQQNLRIIKRLKRKLDFYK
jgi:hypothetical protein